MADRQSPIFKVGAPTDEVNVGGARHLANILKDTGITWIQMSTREVLAANYRLKDVKRTKLGFRPKRWVDETTPYEPPNFYGKSKIVSEFISESHPQSAVIRLTTCYTDFDHPAGNWVVSLLKAATQGKPVGLTQGGNQFRDPLHTDDLARLMLRIHERKLFGEKFHAGGGKKNLISLREFVTLAEPKAKIERRPGGDYGFAFDISKAEKLAGWEPRVMVRDKIDTIVHNIKHGITHP